MSHTMNNNMQHAICSKILGLCTQHPYSFRLKHAIRKIIEKIRSGRREIRRRRLFYLIYEFLIVRDFFNK